MNLKIAVTCENGQVFQHFGHTPEFALFDVEDGKIVAEKIFSCGDSGFSFSLSISLQKRHLIATALISSPQNGHFFVSSVILYSIFIFRVQKKDVPLFVNIGGTPMPEHRTRQEYACT